MNDDRGVFNWDSKNKSYTLEIEYKCVREGWGFPSSGTAIKTAVCQSHRRWSFEELEQCAGKEPETKT